MNLPVNSVLWASAWLFKSCFLHVTVEGRHHVPETGPVLFAARHLHHLYDGVVLLTAITRPVHILVALDWVRTSMGRRFMTKLTHWALWPVTLRSPRANRVHGAFRMDEIARFQITSFRQCVTLLQEGAAVVVFPEGYPNVDPHFTPKKDLTEILSFGAGFARMVIVAERGFGVPIPIIPTGLAFSSGLRWISLRFGEPLFSRAFADPSMLAAFVEQRVRELCTPADQPFGAR